MREILFRGKRVDNGEWIKGFYCCELYSNTHYIMTWSYGSYAELQSIEVIPETVGQYTGLTDKNGKKIFEGDIIRYGLFYDYQCYLESLERPNDYDGAVFDYDIDTDVVVWCDDNDYPAFDLKNHEFECNGLSQIMCGDYIYEVIGNIYDNPELIRSEQE